MQRLKSFNSYNEGILSSVRRRVTGESAGDEIQTLSEKQQEKLTDLYFNSSPQEAAKYLRSIIIKEKNSQFGIGLALTVAGAGMIYKAAVAEGKVKAEEEIVTPPPPKPEEFQEVTVKYGDSQWKFAEMFGGKNLTGQDKIDYTLQICKDNGIKYFYSGPKGSPGLESGWYDVNSAMKGDFIKVSNSVGEEHALKVGQVLKIYPFKKFA